MFTVQQIEQAHQQVKSGADFPAYIQVLKQLGVTAFTTWVVDSHTDYVGTDHFQTRSEPKYAPLAIASHSDKASFAHYLKIHQQGQTGYFRFCQHCAQSGIQKWVVNLQAMTCTYFDQAGAEIVVEHIPA